MMTKKSRFLALALAAILALGVFALAACSKNKKKDTPGDNTDPVKNQEEVINFTDYYLIKDGNCDYTVVMPDNASAREQKAYNELNTLFEEVVGMGLDSVTESEANYSATSKYIVLGSCTDLLAEAGVTVNYKKLGINGYRIKTVGNNIFISGGSQYGTLFGVYKFFNLEFGMEVYDLDEIDMERNVKEKKLVDADYEVKPDVMQLQDTSYGWLQTDSQLALRMGYEQQTEIWADPNGGGFVHNFYGYVNPKDWPDHPEWFRNNQLCLSSKEMYETAFLPSLRKIMEDNPEFYNFAITHRDTAGFCDCADCTAEKKKYGTDAGLMIKFVNKAARDIKEWYAQQGKERDFTFAFFAYNATTEPPVKLNEQTGKYEPIDEDVICDENVSCFFAPIYADYRYGLTSDENSKYRNLIEQWYAVCDTFHYWTYETCFSQYLVPFDNFNSIQDNFRVYRDNNVQVLLPQGQSNNNNSTGFSHLKMYLNSKLRWNAEADVSKLTENWFNHYFGPASGEMREFFDDLRIWFDYQKNILNDYASIYTTNSNTKSWPKGVLDGFMVSVDKAIAAIEPLKTTDPASYTKYYNRINLESLAPRYLLEVLYKGEYSEEELVELRRSIKSIIETSGVSRIIERGLIDTYYADWNI